MADASFCPVLPPPSYISDDLNQNRVLLKVFVISSCVIGTGLFICVMYRMFKIIRRIRPLLFGGRESNFLGENQEQEIELSGGLASSEGLQESLINSITVIKFKTGDSLMGGTDCSVCLCKFQENQRLRLLPQCSHVFHVQCIDDWLRWHENCPLCRAPIFSGDYPALPASSDYSSSVVL